MVGPKLILADLIRGHSVVGRRGFRDDSGIPRCSRYQFFHLPLCADVWIVTIRIVLIMTLRKQSVGTCFPGNAGQLTLIWIFRCDPFPRCAVNHAIAAAKCFTEISSLGSGRRRLGRMLRAAVSATGCYGCARDIHSL